MSPEHSLTPAPGLSAAEVHAHTRASDGMVSAHQLIDDAAQIGLSVLCVTDHDTIAPDFDEAVAHGHSVGVDVVRGEEVTTCMKPLSGEPGIHVVALFLQAAIRQGMTLEATLDAIHEQRGLAVVAHPFSVYYFASIWPQRLRKLLGQRSFDGIELRHTVKLRPGGTKELDGFYADFDGRDGPLGAALGAGDSHFGAHDLGRVVTLFEGSGAADLRKAIEARTTSPLVTALSRTPPPVSLRLRQQVRSMWWLNRERRSGRIGQGA